MSRIVNSFTSVRYLSRWRGRVGFPAPTARLWFAELPLVVFRRKRAVDQFRIDDGCHRAVAAYIAGFRHAFAYIGEYGGRSKLGWSWAG